MHTLYVRAHRYRNFIFDDSTTHSQQVKLKMQYINVNLLCGSNNNNTPTTLVVLEYY